jgi:hypothetical protein
MAEIDLKVCPGCRTAIPVALGRCPDCGTRQQDDPGGGDAEQAFATSEFDAFAAFEALRGAPGGNPLRQAGALAVGPWLRRRLGCLGLVALLAFGLPVAAGLAWRGPLGAVAVLLLLEGTAGLLVSGLLAWLLWPVRAGRSRG